MEQIKYADLVEVSNDSLTTMEVHNDLQKEFSEEQKKHFNNWLRIVQQERYIQLKQQFKSFEL